MYPQGRHPTPHQAGQPFKFTVTETCDRIKEEFQFLQAQYHSLKLECEKLASEKTEMQRHYVMYYEMSYGLNIEMHKQTEIVKRLNAICAQVIPFLSQEHQQLQAQHLAHAHAPPVPLPPHPAGLQPPGLPPGSSAASGLLALSGALAPPPHLLSKEEKNHHVDNHRAERDMATNKSMSPPNNLRTSEKHRNSMDFSSDGKKRKDSDVDKSDDNLEVDVSNEDTSSPRGSPIQSPRENGLDRSLNGKKETSVSPGSVASSSSTPSSKCKELAQTDKGGALGIKTSTSLPRGELPSLATSATPGLRPVPGKLSAVDHLGASLRAPLASVAGPFGSPFGMLPHPGLNGELASPGAYASLHGMAPQMSAMAAAAVAP
uniref:Groucho/TLE N-terminal Q-rich domain-containing protein n=1 Tax=Eptatretus burgeri TaxID=7764 RepID=A0A8C4QFN5_EPTBU